MPMQKDLFARTVQRAPAGAEKQPRRNGILSTRNSILEASAQ